MSSSSKMCLFYGFVIPEDEWDDLLPEDKECFDSRIDDLLDFINEKINGGSGDIHAVCNYYDEDDYQFESCIIIKPKKMGQFGEYCKIGSGFLSVKKFGNLKGEPIHTFMEECCEILSLEKNKIGWHVAKIG